MDLRKIGKFIAKERAEKGYTQESLAEELDISNRAISKWERGICLPDSAHMVELCKLLDVSINDLFNGERINVKDNKEVTDKNLLEILKAKEEKDKQLLALEWGIGAIAVVTLFSMVIIAADADMAEVARWVMLGIATVIFLASMFLGLRIEQIAGYYKCDLCGNKYVPKYWSVFVAMHMGRTRHLRCPKCGKKSWQKKVL